MPLIRVGMRKPPPGFDVIQAKLEEYDEEMKLATQEESKGVVGQTSRRADRTQRKRQREDDGDVSDKAARTDETTQNEASASPATDEETTSISHNNAEAQAGTSTDHATDKSEAVAAPAPVPPLWRMAAINRARTRYVFHAYAKQRLISKEVYDYCVETQLIDGGLARRWRLPGYEHLCCTACGVPGAASLAANTTSKYALRDKQERRLPSSSAAAQRHGGSGDETATCICRVPAAQRKNRDFLACAVCGCKGCCSADVPATREAKEKKE